VSRSDTTFITKFLKNQPKLITKIKHGGYQQLVYFSARSKGSATKEQNSRVLRRASYDTTDIKTLIFCLALTRLFLAGGITSADCRNLIF
jgi:hypothetical protein